MVQESTITPPHPQRSATQDLWQVPIFLLGVVALVGVYLGRSWWSPDPARQLRDHLDAIRQAMQSAPVDATRLHALRQEVQDAASQSATPSPEVDFLLGSADLILAEGLVDAEAKSLWQAAYQRLEKAQPAKLALNDRTRLRHRLAKAQEALDAAPAETIIPVLRDTVLVSVNPAEGYRRLAEAYLRLPTPDLLGARDALKKQIEVMGTGSDPGRRIDAQLQLSQVYSRLHQPLEARQILEAIPPGAPSELTLRAGLELARTYAAEQNWSEAKRSLEGLRDRSRTAKAPLRSEILYTLAYAYQQAGEVPSATAIWASMRNQPGPAGQAAKLRLGQLRLRAEDPSEVVEALPLFQAALAGIQQPSDYENPLLSLGEAREIFEQTIQLYRLSGNYQEAQAAADLYASIAEPLLPGLRRAETAEIWGKQLRQQAVGSDAADAGNGLDEASQQALFANANEQFRNAGKEYQRLAEQQPTDEQRVEFLLKASRLFYQADAPQEAIAQLERVLQLRGFPAQRVGEIQLMLAEAYEKAGQLDDAEKMLEGVIESGTEPAQAKARLLMASLLFKQQNVTLLNQIVELLEPNVAVDLVASDSESRETLELSLHLMGRALLDLKQLPKAEELLRRLLTEFPTSNLRFWTKYKLAICAFEKAREAPLLVQGQIRDAKSSGKPLAPAEQQVLEQQAFETRKQHLNTVREYCREIEQELGPLYEQGQLRLQSGDPYERLNAEVFRQASWKVSEVYYFLGDYDEFVRLREDVANRYQGTFTELAALKELESCLRIQMRQPDRAARIAARMRKVYASLPDASFTQRTAPDTRTYWERYFRELESEYQANPPPTPPPPTPTPSTPPPPPPPPPVDSTPQR